MVFVPEILPVRFTVRTTLVAPSETAAVAVAMVKLLSVSVMVTVTLV